MKPCETQRGDIITSRSRMHRITLGIVSLSIVGVSFRSAIETERAPAAGGLAAL